MFTNRTTIEKSETFSYWTVIDYDQHTKKYHCECVCGNTSFVNSSALRSGTSKSCGCKQKESVGERIRNTNFNAVRHKIYSNYKRAAAKRSHEFALSFLEFSHLIMSNCFYCGLLPTMIYKYGRGNKTRMAVDYDEFRYNGVDRIDNGIGYTLKNCVSCCKICNNSKSTLGLAEWQLWIDRVYNFMKGKNQCLII